MSSDWFLGVYLHLFSILHSNNNIKCKTKWYKVFYFKKKYIRKLEYKHHNHMQWGENNNINETRYKQEKLEANFLHVEGIPCKLRLQHD
jgi:hypothetical protein